MLVGDLGLSLLASVDYVDMARDILELLNNLLSAPETEIPINKISLIVNLSYLLKAIFVYKADLYENLAQVYDISKLLLKGISFEYSSHVRSTTQELIYFISMNVSTTDRLPLIQILTPLFDSSVLFSSKCATEELYELILILLNECTKASGRISFDATEKFNEIMQYFSIHEFSETTQSTDITLLGLLRLAARLIRVIKVPEGIINSIKQIFYGGLFPDSKGYFKCKSIRTRYIAYELLVHLGCFKESFISGSMNNLGYLIKDCILPLREKVSVPNNWGYSPSNNERSRFGYTGLKNICCICYINSMLQQFFMISPFRNAILSVQDGKPPKYAENGIDDNLLHQFQRTFVYLMNSARKDYVPSSFCYSFKEFDGQPTNTAVQHDALEFINILFERLEQNFKETPYKQLLQSVFGGKSCSQVLCSKCGYVSATYEDYYTLSLEIKNRRTLGDSLDRFIAESTVSDYKCSKCQNRVDATKRTIISTLPNVLIIHLQRFSFNFDTLMNEKIHTRLEFPTILDMTSYTEEGCNINFVQREVKEMEIEEIEKESEAQELSQKKLLKEKEYYTFKLVGVVMHNGNAEAGHYYSYINTNRGKNEEDKDYLRPEIDHWLEFNDSIISEFNFSKLENECFGGSMEQVDYMGENSEVAKLIGGRSKSAYILLYERQKKENIALDLNPATKKGVLMSLDCDSTAISRTDTNGSFTFFNFHAVPAVISSELLAVL